MTLARALDHADRNEILRRADLSELFDELGGRRRGRALHCVNPSHKDKTPSAAIKAGRFRCFSCGLSLDCIGLVQHCLGVDFQDALRWLGARYGVPVGGRKLSPAERQQYACAAAGADALAQRLADFARGLELVTERRLTTLSAALLTVGIDPTETLSEAHHQARLLSVATPHDIAATWRAMPTGADVLERIGQEARENAETITRVIVDMLAASQRAETA